ncbi:cytochrome c oxidase subunit 3 [Mycolicibacterium sp. 050158]|uniref:cytochrome c oxidase subunit 3 n=1 Tax=Mycolicibacterium sp. 050158 TaxID=3090602 RepID=UPI00299F19F6|nr:cytochrome c oxidase subunit 3 [Mycolicibacterium sp. 050158]MDX1888927.1 cytochrome c oxidase subunit 3 [Mycolicibacterium sp. 050158]
MTHPELSHETALPEFLGGGVEVDPPDAPRTRKAAPAGHIPGEAGLWIFLLGDMTLFAAIMLVFLWDRRAQPEAFTESAHQLLRPVGAVNTLVLLLSSYLVVRALAAHRTADLIRARRLVVGATGCAAVFVALKAVEYTSEISAGHTPASGTFFTFYFVLTGLHLLHVVIGSALLLGWRGVLARQRPWAKAQGLAEGIACYWHMVDLLWVAIFAIVYLVSAE